MSELKRYLNRIVAEWVAWAEGEGCIDLAENAPDTDPVPGLFFYQRELNCTSFSDVLQGSTGWEGACACIPTYEKHILTLFDPHQQFPGKPRSFFSGGDRWCLAT